MFCINIPATSANLGSGFDSLGVAVDLYNKVWMQECDRVDITSKDDVKIPTDKSNLIYYAAELLFSECGKKLDGLKIVQENNIPFTRGLGSSSACIVAGLLGANKLLGNQMSMHDLVNYASKIEGHPDNTTPALLGGLVTSAIHDNKVYYVKQEIHTDIAMAAFIPNFELSTSLARSVLPKEISSKDAIFNLSRSALMSVSLYSGNYENLRVACDDRLHQPYRLSLIKGADKVFDLAYKNDAYAAYISGAGSTLMAMYNKNDTEFTNKMVNELKENGLDFYKTLPLSIENNGAYIVE